MGGDAADLVFFSFFVDDTCTEVARLPVFFPSYYCSFVLCLTSRILGFEKLLLWRTCLVFGWRPGTSFE